MTEPWPIEHLRGSAGEFHARPVPAAATAQLWWFDVQRPAVVLGSTQADEVVDAVRAEAAGMEIARRRSGGGAVHLDQAAVTWVDVVLPAGDPRWEADVSRSFGWLGQAWATVLRSLGHDEVTVHRGPMERTPWSDLVCFGGVGPGEVLVEGRKVVGISQRRTRDHARFQCAVLHRWDPQPLLDVLALTDHERVAAHRSLADVAVGVGDGVAPAELVNRIARAVAGSDGPPTGGATG